MKAIAERRHHRFAPVVLLLLALVVTGAVYAALSPAAHSAAAPTQDDIEAGEQLFRTNGMALFRTNCSMCHGAIGKGGALTDGKFAPSLDGTTPRQVYEAMETGPSNMPVFNDANLTPEEKRDVIAFLAEQKQGSPGGQDLGSVGPVSEGLWVWVVGLGLLIGCAVWIGAKAS